MQRGGITALGLIAVVLLILLATDTLTIKCDSEELDIPESIEDASEEIKDAAEELTDG